MNFSLKEVLADNIYLKCALITTIFIPHISCCMRHAFLQHWNIMSGDIIYFLGIPDFWPHLECSIKSKSVRSWVDLSWAVSVEVARDHRGTVSMCFDCLPASGFVMFVLSDEETAWTFRSLLETWKLSKTAGSLASWCRTIRTVDCLLFRKVWSSGLCLWFVPPTDFRRLFDSCALIKAT